MKVAIAHDYLTQIGGAERVVLSLLRAFPDSELHTLLYEPSTTYREFAKVNITASPLNAVGALRQDHRRGLPVMAFAARRMKIDADLVIASTSGWAHGFDVRDAALLAYCYSPARWLYQRHRYLGNATPLVRRLGSHLLHRPLLNWDQKAAERVDRYIAISTVVQERIRNTYGRESEIIPAPLTLESHGDHKRPSQFDPARASGGFYLCVSRLLPYKNVREVMEGCRYANVNLVIVGRGPESESLRTAAGDTAQVMSDLTDSEMAWLYANCTAVVAGSYEDFGLTPLEGAAHGKPSVALRFGGYIDTVIEGRTGVFFDTPTPAAIAGAIYASRRIEWSSEVIRDRAGDFSEEAFIRRIRDAAFRTVEEHQRLRVESR